MGKEGLRKTLYIVAHFSVAAVLLAAGVCLIFRAQVLKEKLVTETAALRWSGSSVALSVFYAPEASPGEGDIENLRSALADRLDRDIGCDAAGRFDFGRLFEYGRHRRLKVMRTNHIAYPFWENAARLYELRICRLYMCGFCFIAVSLAVSVAEGVRFFKSAKSFHQSVTI